MLFCARCLRARCQMHADARACDAAIAFSLIYAITPRCACHAVFRCRLIHIVAIITPHVSPAMPTPPYDTPRYAALCFAMMSLMMPAIRFAIIAAMPLRFYYCCYAYCLRMPRFFAATPLEAILDAAYADAYCYADAFSPRFTMLLPCRR